MSTGSDNSIDAARIHDSVCRVFEDHWRARRRPRIEDALSSHPEHAQEQLFSELLDIELWWRRVRGEPFGVDDYLKRFPARREAILAAFARAPAGSAVTLDVTAGPLVGRAYEFLSHESLLIGRAADVALSVPADQRLSRHHCRFELNPPLARVVDLDSRNGTFVNGMLVESADLHDGDVVQIGATHMIVRIRSAIAGGCADPWQTVIVSGPVLAADRAAMPAVPGYELLEQLGPGGFGVVYRARQLATNRLVAVKFILPHHTVDAKMKQLFLREATVLSQLQHPRVVEFLELGMAHDQLYLVMEHVPTVSFDEVCRSFTIERRCQVACGIVCRILEALAYAHQRGFVHRDVKPANILLFRTPKRIDGKLADFGLAKNFQTAGFSGMTDDNTTRGSLAYMPPEQVRRCRYAGPSCDLYAIGVTLFQYITGELPFDFTTAGNAIRVILEDRPRRADEINPAVPKAVADIIERSLAKDPACRFASAEELRSALSPHTSRGARESAAE